MCLPDVPLKQVVGPLHRYSELFLVVVEELRVGDYDEWDMVA
jgi:hypothetical protein